MRWFINYIRSLFCKHEWEYITRVTNYSEWAPQGMPIGYTEIYRCKKCGYVQKNSLLR